jgi:hypothetical protein
MRKQMARMLVIGIAALLLAEASFAQSGTIAAAAGDKYVISANAGGVNFVQGTVGVARKVGKSGVLLKNDTIEVGDRVSTGSDGMAEILLNPGSYLRLGPNSAFEFKTTSLDDLRIMIDRGSAILEVFAADDFKVAVSTSKTTFHLVRSGIYRIDAGTGDGKIAVWKGLAEVAGRSNTPVKGGRMATVSGGNATVAKFDRDDKDALEIWSKDRAKELAKISSQLQRNSVRTALMRSFLGRGWNMYNSFGLWVYDPFRRNYCFLPFGYGWGSPYGYGYGHYLGWYNLPPVIYQHYPTTGTGGTPTPPTGAGIRNSTRGRTEIDHTSVPPFVRMQNSGEAGTRGGYENGRGGDRPFDSGQSTPPIYSPPPGKSDPPPSEPSGKRP